MRILIHLLLIYFIVACGTSKPLTPQQALQQLSDSYTSGDMAKVAQLLSTNSKKTHTKRNTAHRFNESITTVILCKTLPDKCRQFKKSNHTAIPEPAKNNCINRR